jgi:Fe-S cluster assembly protein SufD
MALAQAKLDLTEARLAGFVRPEGEAAGPRRAQGRRWPVSGPRGCRRGVTSIGNTPTPHADAGRSRAGGAVRPTGEAPLFDGIDRLKMVFVDGVFDAEKSDDLALEGVEIERLCDVLKKDIHWARDLYGVLETRGQDPVDRPLAALNTGFATDGIVIRATGKAAKPISLIYLHRDETSDAILHHLVRVEPGAR